MISDPHNTTYIFIKGIKIPIWTYGNKKNPPIIFIHGYFKGFSEYIGDLPPRYLMRDFYVIAFDLPGFGKAKEIIVDNIEFISEVQDQILKNKKVNLFGISYGGLLALKYSYKFPNKVKANIIAGTPVFFGIFHLYKLISLLPHYKGKKINKDVIDEFGFLNKMNLKKIKIPTLLFYSKSDYAANIFMGRKLNSMIANSKLVIIKNLNHNWLLHRIDKSGLLKEIESIIK